MKYFILQVLYLQEQESYLIPWKVLEHYSIAFWQKIRHLFKLLDLFEHLDIKAWHKLYDNQYNYSDFFRNYTDFWIM